MLVELAFLGVWLAVHREDALLSDTKNSNCVSVAIAHS